MNINDETIKYFKKPAEVPDDWISLHGEAERIAENEARFQAGLRGIPVREIKQRGFAVPAGLIPACRSARRKRRKRKGKGNQGGGDHE